MKKIYSTVVALFATISVMAQSQGWPANYGGVMLQGFSWDSYKESKWTKLESQAADFKGYIDLIWVPQSGKCQSSGKVMGYKPYYYFNQNSSFGTEEQLRSMIKTFKANGIGTIADVVVNHHDTNGWFDFPAETYKGETYQFKSTDIVSNDDGGKTLSEAQKAGVSLSKNIDEGEDWDGCRDLDHQSANVQRIIKAYVKYLKDDLGYTGFRYDMVKGFYANHVGDYNDAAGIDFSVGEDWTGNEDIENWINYTSRKSAAFDFQFRYNIRDAVNKNNWGELNSTNNLMHDTNYRRYAVTFVENHDMQDRGTTDGYTPDDIKTDIPACNAYMLAMPGTPCIFQPHWLDYKDELKLMIDARKLAGITNQSNYNNLTSQAEYYANEVYGDKANLIVVVGYTSKYKPTNIDNYVKIIGKSRYNYYLSKSANVAWINKPGGVYTLSGTTKSISVKLTAVSTDANAKLVYTIDGTNPTINSTQVNNNSTIKLDKSCTLKVGLLTNGTVTGISTREYTIQEPVPFEPYKITVYVNDDQVNWSNCYFHSFGSTSNTATSWPGKQITATKEINGKKWYYQEYNINSEGDAVSFVFNEGKTGTNVTNEQTVDVEDIAQTTYLVIENNPQDAQAIKHYSVKDVTEEMTTGIADAPIIEKENTDNAWYTLSGMKMLNQPTQAGIYIHQGKKVVIR